jgi:2',3'-cyclic-nucleotide 2'-phosphodiesterase/3'-nucleotidase
MITLAIILHIIFIYLQSIRHRVTMIVSSNHAEIDLCILATSDVHAALTKSDGSANPAPPGSLAQLAHLIDAQRAAHQNCLLFDNGDFLQGTPLADFAACDPKLADDNPIIGAMNLLNYDAVGLGNHEFDFGIAYLTRALEGAQFPTVSSNTFVEDAPWSEHLLLQRSFLDTHGGAQALKIGVLSVLTTATLRWNKYQLSGRARMNHMLESATAAADHLRDKGADLIIALCHSGVGLFDPTENDEALGAEIAAIAEIDAVVCGHTHRLFPPDHAQLETPDFEEGRINNTAVVMPGANASHLGKIELRITYDGSGWNVAACRGSLLPVTHQTREAPGIPAAIRSAAEHVEHELSRPVGTFDAPLTTYFSLTHCDAATRLTTEAMRNHVSRQAAGTEFENLPVVATASPFRFGGSGGPSNFVDIAAGQIERRALFDLLPFRNDLVTLCLTGAQLRDWLEKSASVFAQVLPGHPNQPLLGPGHLPHYFDTVCGVTYQIDPSQPARYDAEGRPIHPDTPGRIKNLKLGTRLVVDDMRFLCATTSYRAGGGGHFPHATQNALDRISTADIRRLLADTLAQDPRIDQLTEPSWTFADMPKCSATLLTGPNALPHLGQIEHLSPTVLGTSEDGFVKLRLNLGRP